MSKHQTRVCAITALVLFSVYSAVATEAPFIKSVSVTGTKIPVQLETQAGRPYDSRVVEKRIHFKEVNFVGHLGLSEKELRGALQDLRIRRILPKVPGIWGGCRLLRSYSANAVDADLARVRSLYVSKGYFDADVRLYRSQIDGHDARVSIFVDSGPRYHVRQSSIAGKGMSRVAAQSKSELFSARDLCSCLFAARRQAEREGVLDFSPRIQIHRVTSPSHDHAAADVTIEVQRGPSYRVGRIDFSGNHSFSDAAVRRNFVLNESCSTSGCFGRASNG